uniref:Uncharacterized protein n=1 Tax=Amphimedon queenslandica TaxID=400682 RepID=A0A1X7UZQ5_AMPQE
MVRQRDQIGGVTVRAEVAVAVRAEVAVAVRAGRRCGSESREMVSQCKQAVGEAVKDDRRRDQGLRYPLIPEDCSYGLYEILS